MSAHPPTVTTIPGIINAKPEICQLTANKNIIVTDYVSVYFRHQRIKFLL